MARRDGEGLPLLLVWASARRRKAASSVRIVDGGVAPACIATSAFPRGNRSSKPGEFVEAAAVDVALPGGIGVSGAPVSVTVVDSTRTVLRSASPGSRDVGGPPPAGLGPAVGGMLS